MTLCLSSCISSSQEQPTQVDETNLFLMFLPLRSPRSSRRGVVNNNQQVLGVGYDDEFLLLGPQPQEFQFVLRTYQSPVSPPPGGAIM